MFIKINIQFFVKLYCALFIDDAKQYKSLFKISNVERLVLEIKAKLNLHFDANTLRSGMSACDIVESDMYGFGLGCAVSYLLYISDFYY